MEKEKKYKDFKFIRPNSKLGRPAYAIPRKILTVNISSKIYKQIEEAAKRDPIAKGNKSMFVNNFLEKNM